MAHFAELNANNVVLRVIVVDNKDTRTADGVEKESIGKAHCEKLFGGKWVQTSYNHNFRKRYAGVGMIYREDLDAFIEQQPFPSWTLNTTTTEWDPPVAMPTNGKDYKWDEQTQQWIERT